MTTAIPRRYRVTERRQETHDTATLELMPVDEPLAAWAPGQFTMLTAFGVGEVPISISGAGSALAPGTPLVHTVRAVGAVSQALHDSTPGDLLGVRGPFGIGWDLAAGRGHDVILVAGGCGLAPIRPVLLAVLAGRREYGRIVVLAGARTPGDLLFTRQLGGLRRRRGIRVEVTVDRAGDDWRGHVGVVPALLDQVSLDPERTEAYVCGPEVMVRFTADALLARGVPSAHVQVSLERSMHCGAGLCGHCQLGPLLLCRDGPVVTYDRVASLLTVEEL